MSINVADRRPPPQRLWTPRLVATLALFVVSAAFFCVVAGLTLVRQADDRQGLERRAALIGAIDDIRNAGADFRSLDLRLIKGIERTALWTRGVDPAQFHPSFRSEEFRRRLGLGPGDLLVTYVGRVAREKDIGLLLDVWPEIAGRHPRATLAVVGQGPLEASIRQRGLPRVHVTGLLQGRALSEAYASADVYTFPSPTETFGNSLLEALASGVPSIAADTGGVLEFARHGENAWLTRTGDRAALDAGLDRLLGDPALRNRLREGALRTAGERRWDLVYDRLVADYGEVLENARRRAA